MNHTHTDLGSAVLVFSWIEYSVCGALLLLSLLVGVYFGWIKKQDSVSDYLVGNRELGVLPVTMSYVASNMSSVMLLGVPTEVYAYGSQYAAIFITIAVVGVLITKFIMPVFFHLQLNTPYEYLELRFSKNTRTLGSLMFAIFLLTFIPVVIYVPALAFNQATGYSVHLISLITSLICTFYTVIGGLNAVVWTTALQGVLTLSSMIFILTLGYLKIGSIEEFWRINSEGTRLEFFNMHLSPFERNTLCSVAIGSTFTWLSTIGVNPSGVQRYTSVATLKESKRVIAWSCLGFAIGQGLIILIGLLIYARYHDCDPVATKMIRKTNQILPFYVMDVARDFPGITGLFVSGLLSAALSSMSSGLNIVAGTLYDDFVKLVLKGVKLSEDSQNLIIKILILLLGLVCVALVFVVERLGSLFQMAISLQGILSGSLVGLFSLGLLFPRANSKGAIAGASTSLLCMAVIVIGAQWYIVGKQIRFPGKVTSVEGCLANLTASLGFNASDYIQTWADVGTPVVADESVSIIFRLSYMYYCMVGTLIVFIVGLPVSYMTAPQDLHTLDPHLISPPIRRFLPQRRKRPDEPSKEEYMLVNTNPTEADVKFTNGKQTIDE